MRQFVKTAELCGLLALSRKQVLERAREERWPCVKTERGVLFVADRLPASVQFKLTERAISGKQGRELTGTKSGFANAREKDRDTAQWRVTLITACFNSGLNKESFIEAYNRQETARSVYARLGAVSVQTFYRWVKAYRERGIDALVPRQAASRGGDGASLSDIEKDYLKAYWLDSTQPSIQHALRKMLLHVPQSRCTYQTARRFLTSLPPVVRDYARLGRTRFENLYLPYVEQAVEMYGSLDCVVSDHHCLDCVVMYRGKLIRPWLTTFQDYRSGKVLGWCPCVTPSSLSIIVAYYMVCWYYGIPKKVLFDNGKDYRSRVLNGWSATAKKLMDDLTEEETEVKFAGIFATLGSDVHFTRTYNGKSKGRQERYFRIIGEYLAKDIGSYVGSDSRSRPEEAQLMFRSLNGMAKRTDVPEWEDYVKLCNTMIPYINDTFKSDGKGIRGMTRSEAFEKFKTGEFRRVSKEELQSALCTGSIRRCTRQGVTVNYVHYWSEELTEYIGRDVVVRTQLVFDNKALIYTERGEFICECEGDYFAEDRNDVSGSIERVERVRRLSLARAAELGATKEVELDKDARIMHRVAENIYNQAPESIDDILGISWEEASSYEETADAMSDGGHKALGCAVSGDDQQVKPVKRRYKSALDADESDYIDIPDLTASAG